LSIRAHPGLPLRLRRLGGRGSVRGSPCDEPARLRFTSLRPPSCGDSAGPSRCVRIPARGTGDPFETVKFFSVLPMNSIEQVPGFRRKHAPYPVATEKIFGVEKTDRRKQRGDEVTASDGIHSTFPWRPTVRVCARNRTGQGLAPRVLAPDYDSLLTERAFFGYSKPSPRD